MKVPALTDQLSDGSTFKLFESHAMLIYLCESMSDKVAENWYPKRDLQVRAKINEYLHWHHLNLRHGAEGFLVARFFTPFVTGIKTDPKIVEE